MKKSELRQIIREELLDDAKDKIVRIKVDWNSEESIKNAEKKKFELENKGYNLIKTIDGITTSTLMYSDK